MARTTRGVHRILGAAQSSAIPEGARCAFDGVKGCRCGPAECVLISLTAGRRYLCRAHGSQGQSLGYEVHMPPNGGRR